MGRVVGRAIGFVMAAVLAATPAAASTCAALCNGSRPHHESGGTPLPAGDDAAVHGHHGGANAGHAGHALPPRRGSDVAASLEATIDRENGRCCDAVWVTARAFGSVRLGDTAPPIHSSSALQPPPLRGFTLRELPVALRRGPPGAIGTLLPPALRPTILRI